uniref:Retrovirus-related Pol polyprotein from transposon TNT 1-94 n=1 Tax=Cajanus cajan TaxID=3821 RepID=A0A151S0V0_CAJCA|nr:Retrovirus-related Pol polyprotein from transposon TNT 1-94 [Cajanus cajan]
MQSENTLDALATNVTGICMNVDFPDKNNTWIIDLGATSHICRSKTMYNSYSPIQNSNVLLPNSTKVKVEGIGGIKLNDDIFLHSVLHIPNFRFNLLSLLTIINENCFKFVLNTNSCILQGLKTLRKIGIAKQHQRLLLFDFPKSDLNSVCNKICNSVTYDTWHQRLGHVPTFVYRLIANKTHLSAIDSSFHCSTCNLEKQNRLPFINRNNFSANSFDLIHADIWGPFRESTYDGYRYFLTLVDDMSRFTWIYLLKNKSECINIIPQFYAYVENQFQSNIKTFRSDNAKELAFKEYFSKKGIMHQFSCVERPQQNSVMERKHLHILNIARGLMFKFNVPLNIWGDFVKTTVFLMNRTPSPILNGKSPYELLYNKLPNYSSFRAFGTLCYASTPLSNRHKFIPRATVDVFINYSQGYKGYKLLDLSNNQVFISRDVRFYEHIFPFKRTPTAAISEDTITPDITPNLVNPNHEPEIDVDIDLPTSTPHSSNLQPLLSVRIPLLQYYSRLFESHTHFICQISENFEPQTYNQAIKHKHWRQAIEDEIAAKEVNNTWTIQPLPPEKKPISCKWLFKLKLNSDGKVAKHKAQLVARGFTQQYGLDFQETFSLVAKITTLRVLLALAASKN